ncbi:MAG: hypothetical protein COC04_04545 [Gammaproteobacteria bacterium]|nr:MAG: hypothetical protein COC04_04545 [Gammaproteobacteria bacterium]
MPKNSITIALITLLISGCGTTHRFYLGEQKHRDDIATIVSQNTPMITDAGALKLNLVNGESPVTIWNWGAHRWEMPPGDKTLTFQVNIPKMVGVTDIEATVEAGKVYYAKPIIDLEHYTFTVQIEETTWDVDASTSQHGK